MLLIDQFHFFLLIFKSSILYLTYFRARFISELDLVRDLLPFTQNMVLKMKWRDRSVPIRKLIINDVTQLETLCNHPVTSY